MSTHIEIELPRNSRSPDAIALLKGTCSRSSVAGAIPNCRPVQDLPVRIGLQRCVHHSGNLI